MHLKWFCCSDITNEATALIKLLSHHSFLWEGLWKIILLHHHVIHNTILLYLHGRLKCCCITLCKKLVCSTPACIPVLVNQSCYFCIGWRNEEAFFNQPNILFVCMDALWMCACMHVWVGGRVWVCAMYFGCLQYVCAHASVGACMCALFQLMVCVDCW